MLGVPWLAAALPAEADTTTAAAGACLVSLEISGGSVSVPSPPPPLPPLPPTPVDVTGGGLCVVNGDGGIGITIDGTLTSVGETPTWTCLGGAADGQLTINVTHPKVSAVVTADVTLTAVGGVAVMTAVDDDPSRAFVGEGNFVEDVMSHATCPTSGASSTSWCGTFAFTQVAL